MGIGAEVEAGLLGESTHSGPSVGGGEVVQAGQPTQGLLRHQAKDFTIQNLTLLGRDGVVVAGRHQHAAAFRAEIKLVGPQVPDHGAVWVNARVGAANHEMASAHVEAVRVGRGQQTSGPSAFRQKNLLGVEGAVGSLNAKHFLLLAKQSDGASPAEVDAGELGQMEEAMEDGVDIENAFLGKKPGFGFAWGKVGMGFLHLVPGNFLSAFGESRVFDPLLGVVGVGALGGSEINPYRLDQGMAAKPGGGVAIKSRRFACERMQLGMGDGRALDGGVAPGGVGAGLGVGLDQGDSGATGLCKCPCGGCSSNSTSHNDDLTLFHLPRRHYSRTSIMPRSPFLLLAWAFLPVFSLSWSSPLQAQEDPYAIPMEDEDEGGLTQEELEAKAEVILPRVAQMRGWAWKKPVPVGITTPDEFIEFASKSFAEEYGSERLAGLTSSYVLLGFMEPGLDFQQTMLDMLRSQVGGYYDPDTAKFYMMSTFNKGSMADYIMAHELCHALDDQYFDLNALFDAAKGNSDREFAVRCVAEGSASSLGNLYLMRGIQEQWLDSSDLMDADMVSAMMGSMEQVPPFFVISLALPYIDGNTFVVRETSANVMAMMMKTPADADLKHMFAQPPTSSEQILHPEKYWDEASFDPPLEVKLPDVHAQLGAGWRLADTDVLGELGCAMLTMKNVPTAMVVSAGGARMVAPASAGWGGDLYRCYVHEDGRAMMHWKTLWDTEADAEEFAQALRSRGMERAPLMRRIDLEGNRVEVWFATDDAVADLELL